MRFVILTALLLSACTSIVPGTVMRLNAISPLEADPADFAVAITLPDGLGITPNSAQLAMEVSRTDTGESRSDVFILERLQGDPVIYQIAPDDHADLRALQAISLQWQEENDDATSGSIGVTLAPCKIGNGPAADARVSVAIRTAQDGAFLPLIRNGPVSAVADPDQIHDMGACP